MLEHIRFALLRFIAGKMPVMLNIHLKSGELPMTGWSAHCKFEGFKGRSSSGERYFEDPEGMLKSRE